ncbi:histidine kinase [Actinosynnema sp. NPDC020468]|uniref:ATP-binding protein n=1 Tax=Actinosynnema sp. NPDC020468 TaxID=3154488 RepID=UPI0033D7A2ED
MVVWSVVGGALGVLALAAWGTVRVAVVTLAAVLCGGVGVAVLAGVPARIALGGGLVAAGAVTTTWALGRWCRRWWAVRSATLAHRAAAATVPDAAAAAERRRMAAVLHDVAAHRLTSIVVAAGAAARLADPALRAEAIRHAAVESRRVVADLDRLADTDRPPTLPEVDAIAAGLPGVEYRREVPDAPPEVVLVVYRVVLESLTNALRYASGAAVRVLVEGDGTEVVVTVADSGGRAAAPDVGSGRGLAGLREAVVGCGGGFTAGRVGTGWTVCARVPVTSAASPDRRRPLDWVAVLLATATSIGFQLVADDPLPGVAPTAVLLAVYVPHALAVGFRHRAPRRAAATALGAFWLWLGFDLLSWTPTPASDGFLVLCWVDLVLVHTAASAGFARSWLAAVAVAGTGGVVLASGAGITGGRVAAAVVLAGAVAVPAFGAWFAGRGAGRGRRRRGAAVVRAQAELDRRAREAASDERRRISVGVRRHAREHARAVAVAAEEERLGVVLVRARAAVVALRRLLAVEPSDVDEGPPTVGGVAVLAERRRAGYRRVGVVRAVSPVVDVLAHRVAGRLVGPGSAVTVGYLAGGVELVVAGARPDRRVRGVVDAVGGRVTAERDGTIRVWLPDPVPSP